MPGLWLRLYTEVAGDRKLRRLPAEQRWLWVVVLCVAKESPRPGWLFLSEGVPVTEEDLADQAAVPIEAVRDGLKSFAGQNMVEIQDGVYHVTNWDDRQFESDLSVERTRRYRQKKRQCDAPGPSPDRHSDVAETSPDRHSDVTVTPPESESEIDNNNASPLPPTADPDPAFRKVEQAYLAVKGGLCASANDLTAMTKALETGTVDQVLRAIERGTKRSKSKVRGFAYFLPIVEEIVAEDRARSRQPPLKVISHPGARAPAGNEQFEDMLKRYQEANGHAASEPAS